MVFSIQLKSLLASFYLHSGLFKHRLKKFAKGQFLILMYHRVLPKKLVTPYIEDGMYVTPESFEMQIGFLKKHFNFMHVSRINDKNFVQLLDESDKPICFLTFDDGWYDFYEYAFPILVKYNVPALIFLTTGYINTNNWFWTDKLASLMDNSIHSALPENSIKEDSVSLLVKEIINLMGSSGSKLDQAIKILKKQKPVQIEEVLEQLSEIIMIKPRLKGRSFLRWDEVEKMKNSNLVEFGSHTHMHKLLDKLDEKELIFELTESKNILLNRSLISDKNILFCYPNGNYNTKIITKVQETGYQLAFTTKHSWQSKNLKAFELNRVAIHNDVTYSKSLFAGRILGLF